MACCRRRLCRKRPTHCRSRFRQSNLRELPAEASGIISLKAEEGDAVAVGAVVCFIDTEAKRPDGSEPAPEKISNSSENKSEVVVEQTATLHKESYATGSASPAAKKI